MMEPKSREQRNNVTLKLKVPLQLKSWYLEKSASLGMDLKDLIKVALGTYMWHNTSDSLTGFRNSEPNGSKDSSISAIRVERTESRGAGEVANILLSQVALTEKRVLEEAILQADGNKSEAARILGISKRTMQYKTKKYGL
jgi:DNA-binding NtrC family response regulator